MGMFLVPQGTEAKVIQDGKEWFPENFREFTTTKTNVFEKHEVTIDPLGGLGTNRSHANVVGGAYAKAGFYGFHRDGWTLLVRMPEVQYG